jgi:hypothetical protein
VSIFVCVRVREREKGVKSPSIVMKQRDSNELNTGHLFPFQAHQQCLWCLDSFVSFRPLIEKSLTIP